MNQLIALFEPVNPSFERLYANKTQRAALERMVQKHGAKTVKDYIELLPTFTDDPHAPVITTPYELEVKLGKLMIYIKKQAALAAKNNQSITEYICKGCGESIPKGKFCGRCN
jgi:hypothetical protein